MASDVHNDNQHVNDKGKGPDLEPEVLSLPKFDTTTTDTCVICLDLINERAIALPCKHEQFDFPCLGTWLQQSQVCPLCKAEVKAIRYDVKREDAGSKIFYLPAKDIPKRRPVQDIHRRRAQAQRHHPYRGDSRHRRVGNSRNEQSSTTSKVDRALEFRKEVYRRRMFSAYVGTNRISRYRNITPQSFANDVQLVNRAKVFIRRELQIFDFLNTSLRASNASNDRRANNAEFLLEYIIGILKSIDLKGSTGQAGELLKDFLGHDNAKLFLHELEAWLRSPYERLADWDRHVQYGDSTQLGSISQSAS